MGLKDETISSRQKKTILLVEDEVIVAMAAGMKIKSFGYDVITTYSGKDAVRIASENDAISLILMDIDLGKGIDGTEAARQILAKRNIPIVFLTSHSEEEYVNKVKQITRYGYVIKNSGDFVLKSSIEMAFELFNAYEKTKQSEESYRILVDNTPDFIYSFDRESRHTAVNKSVCLAMGLNAEDIIGKNHTQLGFPDDIVREWQELHHQVFHTKKVVKTETTAPMPDGSIHTYEVVLIPIVDEQGNVTGIRGTSRDITERKHTGEKLKTMLHERETLLKEVYHRTKNNMASICSLLRLQSARIKDDTVNGIFGDIENRVQSLLLVQQKLYQSHDFTHLDLKEYLSDLATTVFRNLYTGKGNVSLRFDLESAVVSPDIAIPCGFIMNELLSNALKYAFPGDGTGEIFVTLHRGGEKVAIFTIRDTGVGMPESGNPNTADSIGLQLVKNFTNQLKGTLDMKSHNGTEWQIRFPM
ncbi:MAG: PAS domain S-box protein [bacterium]|nr:PAS domain S-box protein [bacterium]